MNKITTTLLIFSAVLLLTLGCSNSGKEADSITYDTLQVTSTAYNSVESQTKKGNIGLAAWGDTLKPGDRAIAVSRDLIDSGLRHNTIVFIEGFDEPFLVKDKMNKRWKNKVDIYMGLDVDSARSWGKQKVEIYIPVDTIQ